MNTDQYENKSSLNLEFNIYSDDRTIYFLVTGFDLEITYDDTLREINKLIITIIRRGDNMFESKELYFTLKITL